MRRFLARKLAERLRNEQRNERIMQPSRSRQCFDFDSSLLSLDVLVRRAAFPGQEARRGTSSQAEGPRDYGQEYRGRHCSNVQITFDTWDASMERVSECYDWHMYPRSMPNLPDTQMPQPCEANMARTPVPRCTKFQFFERSMYVLVDAREECV